MTMERQAFGKTGEDLAVAELERRGYAILDAPLPHAAWRNRHRGRATARRPCSSRSRRGRPPSSAPPLRRSRRRSSGALQSDGARLPGAQRLLEPALPFRRRRRRRRRGRGRHYRVSRRHSRRAERVAALIGWQALWYDCHFRTAVWPSLVAVRAAPGERE